MNLLLEYLRLLQRNLSGGVAPQVKSLGGPGMNNISTGRLTPQGMSSNPTNYLRSLSPNINRANNMYNKISGPANNPNPAMKALNSTRNSINATGQSHYAR